MARNPLQDLAALVDGARLAQELVDRKASIEQACRESEARLKSLREEESKAGASLARAHDEAGRVLDDAKKRAAKVEADAGRSAAERWSDCETACGKAEASSKTKLKELEKKISDKAARCVALEAEEAKLGQSVAALRADLEAIKAKLG
jgi:hypothetical protein